MSIFKKILVPIDGSATAHAIHGEPVYHQASGAHATTAPRGVREASSSPPCASVAAPSQARHEGAPAETQRPSVLTMASAHRLNSAASTSPTR